MFVYDHPTILEDDRFPTTIQKSLQSNGTLKEALTEGFFAAVSSQHKSLVRVVDAGSGQHLLITDSTDVRMQSS